MLRARTAVERDLSSYGEPDETGHINMPLSSMTPSEYGHVIELRCDPCTRQHLLELGFTTGAQVDFLRVAPLGDPITVRIRGYQLSLRRHDAEAIWMRRCPPELVVDGREVALAGSHRS